MDDGNYLYRRSVHDWWRACTVKDGKLHASWRTRPAPIANGWTEPPNEFIGPLDDSDPDWTDASGDALGRLFRDPTPVR